MADQQAEEKLRTTIVLEGIDDAILTQIEKDFGLSRSAAVRFIIRRFGRGETPEESAQPQQASC